MISSFNFKFKLQQFQHGFMKSKSSATNLITYLRLHTGLLLSLLGGWDRNHLLEEFFFFTYPW
jgi:hypothetical protein